MSNHTIGFIGAGNMAGSLINGLSNTLAQATLWASCPDNSALGVLKDHNPNLQTTTDNKIVVESCDVIVIAVKPQLFHTVCEEIALTVQTHKPIIISVAAGITLTQMQAWLDYDGPIIRTMPNTPALLGVGATGLFANAQCKTNAREIAQIIFSSCGIACWVDNESQVNIVTALSGSGPAYFFNMVEHMISAAVALGLSPTVSTQLAHQTILGSATLLQQPDASASTLRTQVTSPQGTTAAGLDTLSALNFQDTIAQTLQAAFDRSIALSAANDNKECT